MYKYEDIKIVHLEITEKCQASCPMCLRNIKGGPINPHLNMSELSLEDCKKIFKPEFIRQLSCFYMCGNFGDPGIAKDTLEVFKYLRENNKDLLFRMHTNGGVKNEKWWKELGKILNPGSVTFSIDGLRDTNHLYRQNANWDLIIKNAKAYIDAGGYAIWDYLVFGHNEHQIEEAKDLAKKLGFKEFKTKKTERFFSSNKVRKEFQIIDKKGGNLHVLTKPRNEIYMNQAVQKKEKLYIDKINYYNNTTITCKAQINKKIFISAEGLFLPCCWIGARMYRWWLKAQKEQIWTYIHKAGGKESLNVINNDLKDIINNNRFLSDIKNSWFISSIVEGKLDVCSEKCGEGFDIFIDTDEKTTVLR